jgi:hypothetical protein
VINRLSDLNYEIVDQQNKKTRCSYEQVKTKLQPTNLETQTETERYEEVTQETHFISRRKAGRRTLSWKVSTKNRTLTSKQNFARPNLKYSRTRSTT